MEFQVARIDEEINYWFVRTQQGEFFDEFYLDGFIAVGWDELTEFDILKSEHDKKEVVELIRAKYPEEKQPGLVYTQVTRFINEMQIGDMVFIPSRNSKHLAIGFVDSDVYLVDVEDEDDVVDGVSCTYQKRRKVNWFKTVRREEMDPNLYWLFHSQHTITQANSYAPYIDRALHSLYVKGEKAHLVLRVTTEEQVFARDLMKIINGSLDLVDMFDEYEDLGVDSKEYELKVNVQSPGPVEIIAGVGAIFVLCAVLHYIIGGKFESKFSAKEFSFKGETDGLLEKILRFKQFARENKEVQVKAEEIEEAIAKLDVKVPDDLNVPKEATQNEEVAVAAEQR